MGSELTKTIGSDSKKRQAGGEATDGLLVQCPPTKRGDKVECGPGLPLTLWCCKFAFSLEEECTLAFCMACKEEKILSAESAEEGSSSKKSKRRRGQTDIGVNIVTCCPKGACGRHTEADLVDLVDQRITKDYLKASREKKRIQDGRMWQNTAGGVGKSSRERQTVYIAHGNRR